MKDVVVYLNEICNKLIEEGIRDRKEVEELKSYIIKYKQWTTIQYLEDEIILKKYNNKILSCN